MLKDFCKNRPAHEREDDRYHSVEISIEGLDLPYQFKIWDASSDTFGVLIKEGSNILSLLHVGDEMEVVYYSSDSVLKTRTFIKYIIRNDEGRLKGHYMVGLKMSNT